MYYDNETDKKERNIKVKQSICYLGIHIVFYKLLNARVNIIHLTLIYRRSLIVTQLAIVLLCSIIFLLAIRRIW